MNLVALVITVFSYLSIPSRKLSNSVVVLQLLSKSHLNIIRKLGKKSGYLFNKEKYLRSKEMLDDWRNNFVLIDTCALIELKKMNEINIKGDHAIFTFSVSKFRTFSEDKILTFKDLIHNKIIL